MIPVFSLTRKARQSLQAKGEYADQLTYRLYLLNKIKVHFREKGVS